MLAGIEAPTEAPLAAPQALASQGSEPLQASETDESEAIGLRPVSAETIRSREEAFELLIAVARYFRRTEPHSPISMSIETLVRRGRMDFSELLAELLPEQHARNAVLTAAGIQPSADRGS
jgi:type VI secretion system protein ImpA